MTAPPDQRLAHQEAALIALLERVQVLERALAFEVAQREAMEAVLVKLTGLPRRMDRLERAEIERRRQRPLPGAA
jgi:hypothetical protein